MICSTAASATATASGAPLMTHSLSPYPIFSMSTRARLWPAMERTRLPPGPMMAPSKPVQLIRSTAPPKPSCMICLHLITASRTFSGGPLTTHSSMRLSTCIRVPVSSSMTRTADPPLPITRPMADGERHGMVSSTQSSRASLESPPWPLFREGSKPLNVPFSSYPTGTYPSPSSMIRVTAATAASTSEGAPLMKHWPSSATTSILAPVSSCNRFTVAPLLPMTRPGPSPVQGTIRSTKSPVPRPSRRISRAAPRSDHGPGAESPSAITRRILGTAAATAAAAPDTTHVSLSRSMSMRAPVSSCRRFTVAPPLPITRPGALPLQGRISCGRIRVLRRIRASVGAARLERREKKRAQVLG